MKRITLTISTLLMLSSCSDSHEDPIKILREEKEGVKGLNLSIDSNGMDWRYENGYLYFTLANSDIIATVTVYKVNDSDNSDVEIIASGQIRADHNTIYIGSIPGFYIISLSTTTESITKTLII